MDKALQRLFAWKEELSQAKNVKERDPIQTDEPIPPQLIVFLF